MMDSILWLGFNHKYRLEATVDQELTRARLEATKKYRKLTDYRTKCCYLSQLFYLLTVNCASFTFLKDKVFSVLGHSFERRK